MKVCLAASTLHYPNGGHFWVYLNWALGLRALGCDVIWLEQRFSDWTEDEVVDALSTIRGMLDQHGPGMSLAVTPALPDPWLTRLPFAPASVDDAAEADLLLSLDKAFPQEIEERFRRSAFVDIDPGMTQGWIKLGEYDLPDYDVYFTIGEGVPAHDAGIDWQHVPPCVALDRWQPSPPARDAAFTTVTHWGGKWFSEGGEYYKNDKRTAFLPFLNLPAWTAQPLELALPIGIDHRPNEYARLIERGWRLRDSMTLSDPIAYHQYIADSLGEFSWAKPSYVRLATAWVSDRTVCYLACGKPAVVQYTGPSSFLPDTGGLFRFRDLAEAVGHLDAVVTNYEENCRLARALAEEYFDARKVAARVLELAI